MIQILFETIRRADDDAALDMIRNDPDLARNRHDGMTALHWAAAHGRGRIVELLIDAGADLEAKDDRHDATPIGWANEFGQDDIVALLLDRGALVNLHMAAGFGLLDAVRSLSSAHPQDINRVDAFGAPIHHAVIFGREAVVRELIQAGADPTLRSAEGLTPRQLAQNQIDTNGSRTPVQPSALRSRIIDGCRACLTLLP